MKDDRKFKFYIDAYSPEEFPMAKLAQYIADFAELLGKEHAIHFEALEGGSTTIVSRAEREDVPKVRHRLNSLKQGTAPRELHDLIDRINDRLANDNAIGRILEETEGQNLAKVFVFEGRDRPEPLTYGPFNQDGHLDGLLISIGGKDETISIRLQNGEITYSHINMNRTIARELAPHLFEPVRIYGVGRWMREANGDWTLQRFRVHRFEVLKQGTLREAVTALRGVKGSGWSEIDDPLAELRDLRHGKDEMH